MNKYLKHYKRKRHPDQFGGEFFEEGGWGDWLTPDSVETALNYYGKKITAPVVTEDGISTDALLNKTPSGLMYTTIRDFFSEAWDYPSTQKAAATRNQHAWQFKSEVAKKLINAPGWPDGIEPKWSNVAKAIPSVNLSIVLGVPPNSVADAYAQGAIFAYLTAKMYKKHEFKQLGDLLLQKAKQSPNDVKKPEFEVDLGDPVSTIKSFMGADKTVNAMKEVHEMWSKTAAETDIYPAWYNVPGQLSKKWEGASEINRRLKLFKKPEEINFSRGIAEQSQSSIWDLIAVMKGPLMIGGTAIAGVILFPYIAPLLPTVGRGVISVGRGVGKLSKSAISALSGSIKAGVENAVQQGITDQAQIESIVTKQVKSENPNVSEDDIRRIIRQQLRSA
jgi:hypothetical protein